MTMDATAPKTFSELSKTSPVPLKTFSSLFKTPPEPPKTSLKPPVRILVQTLTHLVPESGTCSRSQVVLNLICRHHWNCDFQHQKFRWASYGDLFAYPNRRCFFLVDYGETQGDDEGVPVLSYAWTGESLRPLPRLAKNPKVKAKLRHDFPFTPKQEPKKAPVREVIRWRLYSDHGLPIDEVVLILRDPEDVKWLKAHVRPRFWRTFVAMANAAKVHPEGREAREGPDSRVEQVEALLRL